MQDHGAAKGKGGPFQAWAAPNDLVKRLRLASKTIPISHPRLRRHIIIVPALSVKIVARHAVYHITIHSAPKEFQRTGHKIRKLKNLVVIDQQRGVSRQNGGRQQTHIPHIGISEHGQQCRPPVTKTRTLQDAGNGVKIACRKEIRLRP